MLDQIHTRIVTMMELKWRTHEHTIDTHAHTHTGNTVAFNSNQIQTNDIKPSPHTTKIKASEEVRLPAMRSTARSAGSNCRMLSGLSLAHSARLSRSIILAGWAGLAGLAECGPVQNAALPSTPMMTMDDVRDPRSCWRWCRCRWWWLYWCRHTHTSTPAKAVTMPKSLAQQVSMVQQSICAITDPVVGCVVLQSIWRSVCARCEEMRSARAQFRINVDDARTLQCWSAS